ncbi:coiled-coil domain-containing protein 93 isoform X2 [Cylas formicarius]|uniref:coiled-coil domain-containing protein 93 isoform X2 n=1 Tax=Cylas formicarius TaxID=197179 RepID=UPI002958B3E3|nr:coiled-coil domain-containing protein 93 isoform X2 [Cylas formicarius]
MAALNPEISEKLRKAVKLPRRQEADGHEIDVEVREDEEQSVKLQEIIDLLVAAGYFRARIKGLPPFDKVVGGMTWCIESLNVDVDVDLLFQENSTIGQKIALTEKIVAVLPKIKCPHRIEPHQIQGLDFIHIFPVIQWLVKRSVEFRQEQAAFVRAYAVNQFNKEFLVGNEKESSKKVLENLKLVQEAYRPQRRYKRKNAPPPDVASRVQITLLEYGYRLGENSQTSLKDGQSDLPIQQQLEEQIQQLLNNLTETKEDLSQYDILDEEDQRKLKSHYKLLHSELKEGGVQSPEEQLENQRVRLAENIRTLESRKAKLQEEIEKETESLNEIRLKQTEVDKALKEFEEVENENQDLAREIEKLVITHDSLKAEEAQFKDSCKQEKARLEKEIRELKQEAEVPTESSPELKGQIEKVSEKARLLRLQLAKKNRIVATLQRQVDDVPNRAELSQYQRRFIELYNQVAAKHKETKQYFSLYNTLTDKKMYMEKELSLLNSISESYPEAMRSGGGKEEFIKQFQGILESVRQSRLKVERKVAEEKQKRDELSDTLQGLVELQRRYAEAVKELGVEVQKYETLLDQRQGK